MSDQHKVRERITFKPLNDQMMFNDLNRAFDELQIAHAALSRVQLVEAFRQALLAGDFIKYVAQVPPKKLTATEWNGMQPVELSVKHLLEERSTIVYLPFQQVEELRAELEQVRTELAASVQKLRLIQEILGYETNDNKYPTQDDQT